MSYFAGAQRLTAALLNPIVPLAAVKSAPQSVISSTTLVNDSELLVTVPASVTYTIDAFIAYTAGGTGDLKLAFTYPAGCTLHWAAAGYAAPGNLATFSGLTSAASGASLFIEGTSNAAAFVRGTLITSVSAGTFQLQFAQNTSNATPTTLLQGSWLRLTRVL